MIQIGSFSLNYNLLQTPLLTRLFFTILFSLAILLTTITTFGFDQTAIALEQKHSETECREGQVLVYRMNAGNYACVFESTSQKWVDLGLAEVIKVEPVMAEEKEEIQTLSLQPVACTLEYAPVCGIDGKTYSNKCRLDASGVDFAYQGECQEQEISSVPIHPEKMTSAAPVPDTASGPAIDFSKGYLVEEIKDGLYWVTDGAYNTIFLTTGQGVIAVDAPPSIGENYLNAIAEVTAEPITHVIYSHTHRDHIGAASMFPSDAVIISHTDVALQLEQRNDPDRPLPTVTFDDEYLLEVGNQSLELKYDGPMHEPGNIFIYAPQQKVLMVVDVVFPGWTPFKDLAMAQDVPAFLTAHDKILEYDFDTYVGGHLTRLGTSEDVKIQQEYFQDIQDNAAIANQEVDFMAIAQEVGFENPWLIFQIYADTITQQCTDATVPDWIDRLGGVDLFTYDHCWKISESQRID